MLSAWSLILLHGALVLGQYIHIVCQPVVKCALMAELRCAVCMCWVRADKGPCTWECKDIFPISSKMLAQSHPEIFVLMRKYTYNPQIYILKKTYIYTHISTLMQTSTWKVVEQRYFNTGHADANTSWFCCYSLLDLYLVLYKFLGINDQNAIVRGWWCHDLFMESERKIYLLTFDQILGTHAGSARNNVHSFHHKHKWSLSLTCTRYIKITEAFGFYIHHKEIAFGQKSISANSAT